MPRLIAHRGMSAIAPENTLAAFRACSEHGVSWFEFDVTCIADGTAVVFHDLTLDRTTDAAGPISALAATDLPQIDAGSWFAPEFAGERIPRLRDVVDLMNEREINANLEIKPSARSFRHVASLVAIIMTELERLDPERTVLISSFNPFALMRVRQSMKHWGRLRRKARIDTGFVFSAWQLEKMWHAIGSAANVTAMHPDADSLTPQKIHRFKRAGFEVNTWTVNDVARARALVAAGADGIITDVAHEFPAEWRN